MIKIKKHLILQPLIAGFKSVISTLPDNRRSKSVDYQIDDTTLSILACMFYKSSSLLKYQRLMKKRLYKDNLQTQFGVTEIPSDNQIRTIISSINYNTKLTLCLDFLVFYSRRSKLLLHIII